MARSTDRILTTHTGSLPRPPDLMPFLERERDGEPFDESKFEECLRASVAEVVREQVDAGIDIVSDGEFGKTISWYIYVNERLSGLEHRSGQAGPDFLSQSTERQQFPEFWAENATRAGGDSRRRGWFCTGPLSYTGQTAIARDTANLKAAIEKTPVSDAFLPVVAPASVVNVRWEESPYKTDEEQVFAVAEALREEYRAIVDSGLLLQVDDAFLPEMYDLMVPPATLEEYRSWASLRIDALNWALRDLPEDRIRYHICWGSFNSPHVGDIAARDVIDLVLRVNAGSYLIEMANPRHEHEWHLWETVKLPESKTLIPGVVNHFTNIVEHPELVAERLERLAKLVGRENLMAGTDCGFSQGPFNPRVHPTIVRAKLRTLAEGAQRASEGLWSSTRV
jgi:5-methyltetrahydropteroyltriglutamate--homocysteine methyltransferase